MPLSEGSLARVREWVGTIEPTDLELHTLYDSVGYGTAKSVALGILRQRLQNFLTEAAQLAAAGTITLGTQANIVGLQKEIEKLEKWPDNLGWDDIEQEAIAMIGVQQMKRVGWRR